MFKTIKSKIYAITFLITIIFVVILYFSLRIVYFINTKHVNLSCYNTLVETVGELNTTIIRLSDFTKDLSLKGADFYNAKNKKHENLEQLVHDFVFINNNGLTFGGGIFFEPYKIDKKTEQFSSYALNSIGIRSNRKKIKLNDYACNNQAWYQELKNTLTIKNPFGVTNPHSSFWNFLVITFGIGIFDKTSNELVGIAVTDLSLNPIIAKLNAIKPTKNSFALFANTATDSVFILNYKNEIFKNINRSLSDVKWYNRRLRNGSSFIFEDVEYISFSKSLANDMIIYVNVPKKELYKNIDNLYKFIFVFIILLVFLIYIMLKYLLLKNIEDPINSIVTACEQLNKNNIDTKIQITSPVEFVTIANSIDHLKNTMRDLSIATIKEKNYNKDLKIAESIQNSALHTDFPPYLNRNEFDIYASMIPARQVGGDFYDFFFIDNKHLAFLVSDVSDKGVPAALFMMEAKTIIKHSLEISSTLKEAVEKTNNALCTSNELGFFVTSFIAVLNTDTGGLKYVNAGHNQPLIKRCNGTYEYLPIETNIALGAFPNKSYVEQEIKLNKDDSIFLYTDGVTEAQNTKKEFYGIKRLQNILNKQEYPSSKDTIYEVKKDIDEFRNGEAQYDDTTMLNLTYTGVDANTTIMRADVELWPNLYKYLLFDMTYKGISKELRSKILIASEEIFVNIASYAYEYKNKKTGSTWIKVEKTKNTYVVTFSDYGEKYNPLERKDPNVSQSFQERQIGGLGIFLVKKLASNVTYVYEHSQNKLILTFNLYS